MKKSTKTKFDICIVCALAEEADAAVHCFERKYGVKFQSATSRHKRTYRFAKINRPGRSHATVQISYASGKGAVELVLHLFPILMEFKPRWAFMTGFCAGDRREVQLGDIIVAERAYFYDSGKIVKDLDGKDVHLPDTDTWRGDSEVLHALQTFRDWEDSVGKLARPISKRQQKEWLLNELLNQETPDIGCIPVAKLEKLVPAWRKIVDELKKGQEPLLDSDGAVSDRSRIEQLRRGKDAFPFTDRLVPKRFIAPMASGSAVRSDDPFQQVQKPVRGTLAIEMEGAAFYRTAAEFKNVRPLVVKGVGDYADQDKDDSYHGYASEASAEFVASVIDDFVLRASKPKTTTDALMESESQLLNNIATQQNAVAIASRLAIIWGGNEQDILRRVRSQLRSRGRSAKDGKYAKVSHIDLLERYYPLEDLQLSNLKRCSYSVDDNLVRTTAVSRPDWLGLTYRLGGPSEKSVLTAAMPVAPQWRGTRIDCGDKKHESQTTLPDVLAKAAASILMSRGLIWNDPIYRVISIEAGKDCLTLSFAQDEFENYRYSIGLLNEELAQIASRPKADIEKWFANGENVFPLRSLLLPDASSVANFSSRMTASGIQVVFAMATKDGGFEIPYQIRSKKVTEGGLMIGIIPMAFHQPLKDAQAEVNPASTVYRELYEELFGGREVIRGRESWNPPNWYFNESEPLIWLQNNNSVFTLECTGISVNLISGNCDLLILAVIHDQAFFTKFGHLLYKTWETKHLHRVSTLDDKNLKDLLIKPNWASQAQVAFIEGLQRLKALEPQKVRLPELKQL